MADIQDFKTLRAKRKSLGVSQVQLAAKAGINVAILANVECGRRRLSLDLAKILYGAIAEIERERTDTIKSLEAVLDDPNSDGGAAAKVAADAQFPSDEWWEGRHVRRQRLAALLLRAKALAAAIEGCEAEEAEIDRLIEKHRARVDRLK
jgi:transcriptional regulator with XRE-family HTH domain